MQIYRLFLRRTILNELRKKKQLWFCRLNEIGSEGIENIIHVIQLKLLSQWSNKRLTDTLQTVTNIKEKRC